MPIGERKHVEKFRMRSAPDGYPGDLIESHDRVINGKLFTFSRVTWASGDVTVVAYRGRSVERVHEWTP